MITPKKPGVYCLKALNSKLIYIGSTKSLCSRKAVHLYSIRKNDIERGCKVMIEASNSGDIVNFEILEVCDNYTEREQFWINFFSTQNSYKIVNQFDAIRENSRVKEEFKSKMSHILKERWKDETYREISLRKSSTTRFTSERLAKRVHIFNRTGEYFRTYNSAKEAAINLNLVIGSIQAASSGKAKGKFNHKQWVFIYDEVLDKLDELLETHQELRAISSEAWETIKSPMNVQRLTGEEVTNNPDTSVQHLQFASDDIV